MSLRVEYGILTGNHHVGDPPHRHCYGAEGE